MLRKGLFLLLSVCAVATAHAQDWYQIHTNYAGGQWSFPYRMDHIHHFDFDTYNTLQLQRDEAGTLTIPFATEE